VHPRHEERRILSELRQKNEFYPYNSHDQYRLAKSLSMPRPASGPVIQSIAVDGKNSFLKAGVGFSSNFDFLARLDELQSTMTPWTSVDISNEGGDMSWGPKLTYWKRDTLAVLQEILENPNLKDKCVWAPSQRFGSNHERVYTDMDSTEWWWETQVRTAENNLTVV
jgi:Plavaka transposase